MSPEDLESTFETSFDLYHQAIVDGSITHSALDGLDGCGKGTLAKEVAIRCTQNGADALIVEFPSYQRKWGKIIRQCLDAPGGPSALGLTRDEMMTLYALNRLETIHDVITTAVNSVSNRKPLHIIFDRFPTSNIITSAFWASRNPDDLVLTDLNEQTRLLDFMHQIDKHFFTLLAVKNTPIYIPIVDYSTVIKSIDDDITRTDRDAYEQPDVQEVADFLYKKLDAIHPQVQLHSQYKSTEEGIEQKERKSVSEIVDNFNIEFPSHSGTGTVHTLSQTDVIPIRIQSCIKDVLLNFGRLNQLNECETTREIQEALLSEV